MALKPFLILTRPLTIWFYVITQTGPCVYGKLSKTMKCRIVLIHNDLRDLRQWISCEVHVRRNYPSVIA